MHTHARRPTNNLSIALSRKQTHTRNYAAAIYHVLSVVSGGLTYQGIPTASHQPALPEADSSRCCCLAASLLPSLTIPLCTSLFYNSPLFHPPLNPFPSLPSLSSLYSSQALMLLVLWLDSLISYYPLVIQQSILPTPTPPNPPTS